MRIGFMSTAVMAADMGTAAMAAHQVGMNALSLSFSFGDGMQAAAVALIGQSLGSKEPQEADVYKRQGIGRESAYRYCSGLCKILEYQFPGSNTGS